MKSENEKSNKPRKITAGSAAKREMGDPPEHIRDQLLFAVENVSWGLNPGLTVSHLVAVAPGVVELKINGRPAWRLVYTLKFEGEVHVLAVRKKTTNGPDKTLIEAVTSRLKDRAI